MDGKECSNDPLFVTLVEQLHSLEPSADSAYYLGILNDKKNISFDKFLDQIEFQTLHRWILNSQNKSLKLKFKLKELDIFIIDEMSMVNIDLIESVLNLLAKDCKIILVGDKNQLSPVNNCSIWNNLRYVQVCSATLNAMLLHVTKAKLINDVSSFLVNALAEFSRNFD